MPCRSSRGFFFKSRRGPAPCLRFCTVRAEDMRSSTRRGASADLNLFGRNSTARSRSGNGKIQKIAERKKRMNHQDTKSTKPFYSDPIESRRDAVERRAEDNCLVIFVSW